MVYLEAVICKGSSIASRKPSAESRVHLDAVHEDRRRAAGTVFGPVGHIFSHLGGRLFAVKV